MDQFEKLENQLLSSYESILAEESRKICKEVDYFKMMKNLIILKLKIIAVIVYFLEKICLILLKLNLI